MHPLQNRAKQASSFRESVSISRVTSSLRVNFTELAGTSCLVCQPFSYISFLLLSLSHTSKVKRNEERKRPPSENATPSKRLVAVSPPLSFFLAIYQCSTLYVSPTLLHCLKISCSNLSFNSIEASQANKQTNLVLWGENPNTWPNQSLINSTKMIRGGGGSGKGR